MIDRLTAARRRVERANRHIAHLEKIVASLPDLDIATVERDVSSGYQIVKHSIPGAEKIAIEMALVLGDAIHNLRVGMEYAYLGAIERHAPSILDGNTKFPARYETRQDLESALRGRKVDILAPRLFDVLINQIKPYKVGGNEFFFRLHELEISDKHWLLVPVTNYAAVAGIIVEDKKGHALSGIVGESPDLVPTSLHSLDTSTSSTRESWPLR